MEIGQLSRELCSSLQVSRCAFWFVLSSQDVRIGVELSVHWAGRALSWERFHPWLHLRETWESTLCQNPSHLLGGKGLYLVEDL